MPEMPEMPETMPEKESVITILGPYISLLGMLFSAFGEAPSDCRSIGL